LDFILNRYAQRMQLPYTEAFINEVLRLGGVAPGMWRNTSQDATYEVIFLH
jgi:hypothetical protein